MEFTDCKKNLPNGNNMGGIPQKIYFGLHADVLTWPSLPDNPATMEENAVLTGDIVMKPGKRMFEIYVTDDTGEFKIEPVGEADGKSFVQHLTFFHPGLKATILGMMNAAKNDSLVFIVPDQEGQMYLMGDEMRAAVYQGAPDTNGTGKATADRKGLSAEFTYKTPANYIYSGNVPLTVATSI